MREERGSAAPLLALLIVAVGGLCLGLGRLGGVANATAQAQTAADAAALAAAAEGVDVADDFARANGARVVRVEEEGDEVEVMVRLGEVAAVARAKGVLPDDAGGAVGPGGQATGLHPEVQAALSVASTLLGQEIPISSGFRSRAAQERLYAARGSNPYPVAVPGTSAHERGRAVDVPRSFAPRLAAIASRTGLCRPWPTKDPVHFELCRRNE